MRNGRNLAFAGNALGRRADGAGHESDTHAGHVCGSIAKPYIALALANIGRLL
jgi:hypothetical protein